MKWPVGKVILGLLMVAVVLGGGAAAYIYFSRGKPDIRKVGGTILVYEVDETTVPADYQSGPMVAAVQRRLDAAGFGYATVLAANDKRIEIQVPRRNVDPEVNLDTVKKLISQQGRLEFLIAANPRDDRAAIDDARQHLTDPANKGEIEQAARAGVPPPVFVAIKGKPTFYPVNLDGEVTRHTYAWVEVGKSELASRHLTDADTANPSYRALREKVHQSRDREPIELYGDTLLYSRTVSEARRQAASDKARKYEYFILMRQAEPGKEITGAYVQSTLPGVDEWDGLAVHFRFDDKGGQLFWNLTTKNRPSADSNTYRTLAIILDRQIITMPRLHQPIRNSAQIAGKFTQSDVDYMVAILRAGALPAQLKPVPVSEITVEPK
jgi:preprotein translocase subunit SecD